MPLGDFEREVLRLLAAKRQAATTQAVRPTFNPEQNQLSLVRLKPYLLTVISPLANTARVNRRKISVAGLHEHGSELRYWRRQTVRKRLEGVELLRQTAHAYDPAAARLPRLLKVVNGERVS